MTEPLRIVKSCMVLQWATYSLRTGIASSGIRTNRIEEVFLGTESTGVFLSKTIALLMITVWFLKSKSDGV